MTNDDRKWDVPCVRQVLDEWIEGKQEAFAKRFIDALAARGEELAQSTISGALSKARRGNEDAIKLLFGTADRRAAFAVAAGRPAPELEARLSVSPSESPLVFAVAADHARGDMNALAKLVRGIAAAGCAPRLVVDGRWRSGLRPADQEALEAWGDKGWLVELDGAPEALEAALRQTYDGASSSRKAWIAGNARRGLPRWQAMRASFNNGGEPTFDPADGFEKLRTIGFVVAAPAAHPMQAADGTALRPTSLTALAQEAGTSLTEELFAPAPIGVDDALGDRAAALMEIARGHPVSEVLQRRQLRADQLPKALGPMAASGHHLRWEPATHLALSLAHELGEQTAVSPAAITQVVNDVRRRAARAQFMRDHPGASRVLPPMDALVRDCVARGLSLHAIGSRDHYAYYSQSSEYAVFIEEGEGEQVERRLVTLTPAPSSGQQDQALASVAFRLKERGVPPFSGHPVAELAQVAELSTGAVWTALEMGAAETPNTSSPMTTDAGLMGEHWARAERAVAALYAPGKQVEDLRTSLSRTLERRLGAVCGLWPQARLVVPAQCEGPRDIKGFERHGPVVLPLRRAHTRAGYGQGNVPTYELVVVRAVLWLKAALHHGEVVELLDAGASRLVVTDLRGFVAEVSAWTVSAGPSVLHAVVPVAWHRRDQRSDQMPGFTSFHLRYADTLVYPDTLWLGADEVLLRIDFGPTSGLLDWEPVNAAEQAEIAADDAAAADDDDD